MSHADGSTRNLAAVLPTENAVHYSHNSLESLATVSKSPSAQKLSEKERGAAILPRGVEARDIYVSSGLEVPMRGPMTCWALPQIVDFTEKSCPLRDI